MKCYIYVLNSKRNNNNYVGFTENLNERLNQHREGKVTSTKYRRPLELVYYEVSFDKEDALHRERYLKTTYGRRYIKNRLKNQIQGIEI
ncbi:MAG: GIY-YIG nuclease family protein [Candidatus Cloacimonetes bacterium]|nr:GIY-YIG nuclease family protein [Candidatus Cloacimonadota bacterium]